MSKRQVLIGFGFLFLLMGTLLAARILVLFGPVLDGDSILPDSIAVLSSLTLWEYVLVSLSAGFFLSGLFMLLIGIVLNLNRNRNNNDEFRP